MWHGVESNVDRMDMSETHVHRAMMNLLWPRQGLPVQTFWDYWVGAHTQISSRLPGIHQYFQHQLDPALGRSFPCAGLLDRQPVGAAGFQGDAEITFASAADLAEFASSLDPLMNDEQNVFDKTISYQASGSRTRTFVDLSEDDCPNGDLGRAEKFMLYAQYKQGDDRESTHDVILGELGPRLASAPGVSKVRIRCVDYYDNDAVTLLAPNVSNWEADDSQYQACVEIMFPSALDRRAFGEDANTEVLCRTFASLTRQVTVLRAVRTYTVYNHGRITTAGLRTPQMAAQIAAIGAVNQIGDQVKALVTQEHVARDRT